MKRTVIGYTALLQHRIVALLLIPRNEVGKSLYQRLPGKDFLQMRLIHAAFCHALEKHPSMQPYLALIRYGHEKKVTHCLSALADVRVIWGGNQTIAQIRKSPLGARASEVTFADRFSLTVIDADMYLCMTDVQTLAYVGEPSYFEKLLYSGIHGIDRIVPIGHTMDFDLLWDGYDLAERLSRLVVM